MIYRPGIQIVTLVLCVFTLVFFLISKFKFGKIPSRMYGVIALCSHIIIYYVFVLLWEADIFSLPNFVNKYLGGDIISFGLWSSAIRLQTALELVLMSITVYRRASWTQRS